jgi:two-component system nitrogen regulation response regulator GlnG
LVTFLREQLETMGEAHRLSEPAHKTPHWLSARAVAEICLAPWPGNVRALKGLAGDLAVHSSDGRAFNSHKFVTAYLKSDAPLARNAARSGDITNDHILDALEKVGWNMSHAAKLLRLDKSTLSRRLSREPEIQRLAKLSVAELERQKESLGGEVSALARELGVSEKLLARRLRSSSM